MKHPYWVNDLTVEHNLEQFEWEIWDRQRSEIVATFNDNYFNNGAVWNILKVMAKKINKKRLAQTEGA